MAALDILFSWLCAGARGGLYERACRPVLRAGLRAGQAAGLLAVFTASGLPAFASIPAAAAVYLIVTFLLSDIVALRLGARRALAPPAGGAASGTGSGAASGAVARGEDEPPAGLSVVASRAERLKDTPISRLMIPRQSIVGCDASATVGEVASIMGDTGLSRVIAFSKTVDRPLGLAHIKDVLPLIYDGKGSGNVEELLRPLVLAPSNTGALDLLRDFQRLKRRVAIVRDLQGERTLGLVSTEDILEEMVGEIQDEREALSASLASGVALVRGDLKVSDLVQGLGMSPEGEEGEASLGELVESLLGRTAVKGDVVSFRGLRLEVEETLNGDIWMIRIEVVRE